MNVATFDTLTYAKRFRSAGFTEQQAEEVVAALRDVRDARLEETATQGDVRELEPRLAARIVAAKAETIQWLFGVAAGQAVFIITILKMFPVK